MRSAFESVESVHCCPQHNIIQTVERGTEGKDEEEMKRLPLSPPSDPQ